MRLDINNMLSHNQALTGSAASSSCYKVGTNAGKGHPIKVLFTVKTTFTDDSGHDMTLTISLQCCSTAGGSYADVVASRAITIEELVAGFETTLTLPDTHAAYMQAYYTFASGTPTGTIDAHIVDGIDTNRSH